MKDYDPNKLCNYCYSNLTYYAQTVADGKPDKRCSTFRCRPCYNLYKHSKNMKPETVDKINLKDEEFNKEEIFSDVEVKNLSKDAFNKRFFKIDSSMIEYGKNNGVYKVYLLFPNGEKLLLYIGETDDFCKRIKHHQKELKKNRSYFGINDELLKSGCRIYFKCEKRIDKTEDKNTDKNIRETEEMNAILKYNGTALQRHLNYGKGRIDDMPDDYELRKDLVMKKIEELEYKF